MSVLPSPAGQPGGDLLQLPAVAIRVAEGCSGEVRASRGVEARRLHLLDLADVDAAIDQIMAGGLDVLDDQDVGLGGPRLSRRPAPLAELDRAPGVRWGELHVPDLVAEDQVDVQPPAEALVEGLGPVNVGDGQRHDLEVHVHAETVGRLAGGLTDYVGTTHGDLRHWCGNTVT